MAVLVCREPWPAITRAVTSAAGRVVAAVAYVGADAHRLLPLKAGDLLVCDCSRTAVRNGATNPHGLEGFLAAGVGVISFEGLHAKVVVLPRRAFVGSANVSTHSASRLFEAVLTTTKTDDVGWLRDFVVALSEDPVSERIDRTLLAQRVALIPERPRPVPQVRDLAVLPSAVRRVVVLNLERYTFSSSEQKALDAGRRPARRAARQGAFGFTVEGISLDAADIKRLRRDDWAVQVVGSNVY